MYGLPEYTFAYEMKVGPFVMKMGTLILLDMENKVGLSYIFFVN